MSESKVARRYSQALLELCDAANNQAVVAGQLGTFVRAYRDSTDLSGVLKSPVVDLPTKRKIIAAAFAKAKFLPVTINFLNVLVDHERIGQVEDVVAQFEAMVAARTQISTATVRSATPLRPADITKITEALSRITGSKVKVEATVDPGLIGGVVAQVGNIVLDGSVATDLQTLRERLVGA